MGSISIEYAGRIRCRPHELRPSPMLLFQIFAFTTQHVNEPEKSSKMRDFNYVVHKCLAPRLTPTYSPSNSDNFPFTFHISRKTRSGSCTRFLCSHTSLDGLHEHSCGHSWRVGGHAACQSRWRLRWCGQALLAVLGRLHTYTSASFGLCWLLSLRRYRKLRF
jgi:hypothetical protein